MKEQRLHVSKKPKRISLTLLLIFFLAIPAALLSQTGEDSPAPTLSQSQVEHIEKFVQQQMTIGKIPGMSVVIVMGDRTVYEKGFGFADIKKQETATPQTLFELGSCSKAFTGLAVLRLEEKGSLQLSDPVTKYIPWLKLKFQGKEAPVTIAQFLYQTSGIPFKSIGAIPEAAGDDAPEKTVRTLINAELIHSPGQKFHYATINYDVLGLVIRKISGLSYEEYIKKNILEPLKLNHTYLFKEEAEAAGMAAGYKLCFKKPTVYDAPVYRGNTPAGYIITNAGDLAAWLKIQMGTGETGTINPELIEKSHVTNPALENSNYAAGWFVLKHHGLTSHSGGNPNFSSYIGFTTEKIGVAVLANSGSNFPTGTGQGILAILRGGEPRPSFPGMNIRFDTLAYMIVLIFAVLILLALTLLIITVVKIAAKKRKFAGKGTKKAVGFIISTLLLIVLVYLISIIPSLLGFDLPLSFGFVWLPFSFTYAILAIFLTVILYYLFFLSVLFFPKQKD
jgi:CubicO group peptidase (beta-lactamase class C family)